MRNTSLSRVRKIILLASVLVLMLALCGCRTRITNNDEVSNVMYDEEGYRQDEYNMRRDALGLGKAPKPVFTGFGAPENDEEYDYGSDSEMLEEYDPDEEGLDPYADTEDTSSDEASTTGGNSGGSQRRVIRRNSSSGSSKASEGVTVKLNPNGGTCKTKSVKIKTGDNYGELPAATRDGYDFLGWYTRKDEGEGILVLPETKMGATKNHTLYAHWSEIKKEEETTYTVVYKDGAGGAVFPDKSTDGLKQGEATPPFGDDPVRDGYSFLGWDPAVAATIDAANADSSHTITYTAKWGEDFYTVWSETFSQTVKDLEATDYTLNDNADGDCKSLVESCKGNIVEDSKNIIVFADNMDNAQAYKDDYPDADSVIVVSKSAAKDTDEKNKNRRLYLKLLLLSKMNDLNIGSSKEDLGIEDKDSDLVVVAK